jgi:hypothetical protein
MIGPKITDKTKMVGTAIVSPAFRFIACSKNKVIPYNIAKIKNIPLEQLAMAWRMTDLGCLIIGIQNSFNVTNIFITFLLDYDTDDVVFFDCSVISAVLACGTDIAENKILAGRDMYRFEMVTFVFM